MKLLDLFCRAGGAAMGYYQAGFTEVVGVDNVFQKNYPFDFVQSDWLEYLLAYGSEFDLIHTSPPCQDYSPLYALTNNRYPRLIKTVRKELKVTGKSYVIENVAGAKGEMINPLMLCGTMFGLRVIRHRLFETHPQIWFAPFSCAHKGRASGNKNYAGKKRSLDDFEYLTITGHDFIVSEARIAMDINWMNQKELSQAIPPAYTKWLGQQLIKIIC